MKNIVIFIPSIKSGGAEKQATILADVLSKENRVFFISFNSRDLASSSNLARLENSKAHVIFLNGNSISKLIAFSRILRNERVDVVFNYLTYCDVLGAIVEKFSGVKKIYNGIRNSRLPYLKYITEKCSHNFLATATIFNCFSGAEYFAEKGFSCRKNIVIPNCFYPISKPMTREDKKLKTIITVGRFVEQKDYLTALKTIAEIKKSRSDFKFQIVGYGDLEMQIRSWISELELNGMVEIFINPNNIPELLENADIYLSTSLFEGTSNSIMEAMNYSLPVVATNVGDNGNLILDLKTGYLHDIADVKNLSCSLIKLLENSDLRKRMGIDANRKLESEFSKSVFESKYLNLI